jgi:hypothetical protein
MGAKASVANSYVNYDQPYVEAGQQVTGKVYIVVHQPEIECVSIGCRVLCQESTETSYTTTSGSGEDARTETHTLYEQHPLLSMDFLLGVVSGGRLLQGTYEFPFAFTVPANAPSSLLAIWVENDRIPGQSLPFPLNLLFSLPGPRIIQDGAPKGDHCKVGYSMQISMNRAGSQHWQAAIGRDLGVVRPALTSIVSNTPVHMPPVCKDLHSCFCCNRGQVLFGGWAESSVLYAGMPTSVKYAAENHSTVQITAVEVCLLETVEFVAKGNSAKHQKVLYFRRMSPEEARLDLRKREQRQDAGYDPVNDLRSLNEILASDQTRVEFTTPHSARGSYNGHLIRTRHELTIRLVTTFGSANPTITLPLQMYPSPTFDMSILRVSAPLPTLPANWAPTVVSVVEMGDPPSPAADGMHGGEHGELQPVQLVSADVYSDQGGSRSDH